MSFATDRYLVHCQQLGRRVAPVKIRSDLFTTTVLNHYNDVIMSTMATQITSHTIVYSTAYSGTDQRKHQSFASLAFMRGIHRGPVNSPLKWPVTRKMFPFDDVIMCVVDVVDVRGKPLNGSRDPFSNCCRCETIFDPQVILIPGLKYRNDILTAPTPTFNI